MRRLPANRRPSHKVILGLAEGAMSRSPSDPSQAFKPHRITDSCMADIRHIRYRHHNAPQVRKSPGDRPAHLRYRSRPADNQAFGDTIICAESLA